MASVYHLFFSAILGTFQLASAFAHEGLPGGDSLAGPSPVAGVAGSVATEGARERFLAPAVVTPESLCGVERRHPSSGDPCGDLLPIFFWDVVELFHLPE